MPCDWLPVVMTVHFPFSEMAPPPPPDPPSPGFENSEFPPPPPLPALLYANNPVELAPVVLTSASIWPTVIAPPCPPDRLHRRGRHHRVRRGRRLNSRPKKPSRRHFGPRLRCSSQACSPSYRQHWHSQGRASVSVIKKTCVACTYAVIGATIGGAVIVTAGTLIWVAML